MNVFHGNLEGNMLKYDRMLECDAHLPSLYCLFMVSLSNRPSAMHRLQFDQLIIHCVGLVLWSFSSVIAGYWTSFPTLQNFTVLFLF